MLKTGFHIKSIKGFFSLIFLHVLCVLQLSAQELIKPEKGFVSWLPATNWEEAILSGNGTMGAMVIGQPFEETIILTHALLFLPNEAPVIPPDMSSYQPKIKELSMKGEFQEVAELGVKLWKEAGYGAKKWTDPFVPAADICFNMQASNVSAYNRTVNYETAEAVVNWTDQRGSFSRKTFVSRADSVIVVQITGTAPITTDIFLRKHPHSWEQSAMINELIKVSETKVDQGMLHYHVEYGKPHSHSPDGYDGLLKVVTKGGKVIAKGDHFTVNGANEVLVLAKINPFKGDNSLMIKKERDHLQSVNTDYAVLLDNQIQSHGEMYNRVSLKLATTQEEDEMDSETLVSRVREASSPGLLQRQFEAARYHILCSAGTNPPNLQGIWSGTWTPAWCSDFTHDGNVQVAISNLLNGNMPELMMGYFNHHEKNLEDYKTNAKQFYGVRGIHVPSHTSSHGLNNHYDETWCMEYWNGGAGWAASYFYDYYLYTHDVQFLKEHAFPFMNEALMFWEDFLTMGEDGKYISVPSYSPENNPLEHRWQNCVNATMDFAIIKELTKNWINAAKVLGISKKEIAKKETFLSYLPAYQISDDGVLKEWMWDGLTDNQAHRHASHLYGLYEIPDQEIMQSENLKKAVKKTIAERMKIRKQQMGGEMAFGMCHLGFAAVNMKDKETAAEILEYLSRFYWTNGMATTHNPGNLFNMDISGGIPSLMTRMIMNSQPGYITLFPAIPDDWRKGEIKGVLARGNIKFNSVKWDNKKVELSLVSKEKQKVMIDLGEGFSLNDVQVQGCKYQVKNTLLTLYLNAEKEVKVNLN